MPSEDTNPMKAENKEEKEKKSSGSTSKKATKATSASAKSQPKKVAKVKKEEPEPDYSPKPAKAANSGSRYKVKKEENDDCDENDVKPGAKRSSNMNLDKELKNKKKKKEEEKKKVQPAAERKKREKKVFDLPGQKRDPPEEKEPLRIFYETLYKQVPNSEMAQIWMMECGLLPEKEAMKVFEKKQKKGVQHKVTSPVKAINSVKSSTRSVTVKKKTPSSPAPYAKRKTTDSTSKKRKVA